MGSGGEQCNSPIRGAESSKLFKNITARNWIIGLNYDDNWRNWRFRHLFTPLLARPLAVIGFPENPDISNELITPH